MKNKNNYWEKIKKMNAYYSAGGWECMWEPETNSFQWPSFEGVKRVDRTKYRNEAKFTHYKRKTLAQASINESEYYDLCNRVRDISESEFRELTFRLKGFELRNYITQKYLTNSEAYSLFYRM